MKQSESFSLQGKIKELEAIEHYFQQPDMNLEEAIAKHKTALELAKEILSYLENAEQSLAKIDIKQLRSSEGL